jgi:hypothetical protein
LSAPYVVRRRLRKRSIAKPRPAESVGRRLLKNEKRLGISLPRQRAGPPNAIAGRSSNSELGVTAKSQESLPRIYADDADQNLNTDDTDLAESGNSFESFLPPLIRPSGYGFVRDHPRESALGPAVALTSMLQASAQAPAEISSSLWRRSRNSGPPSRSDGSLRPWKEVHRHRAGIDRSRCESRKPVR